MMDGRKLDINAPLMSVRRSSAASSPSLTQEKKKALEKRHTFPNHKSDITLDQVTEPVAVPFNWEHIPGISKDDGGSRSQSQPPKESPITPIPSLPPGKSTNLAKQPLEKECNDPDKLRYSNKSNSLSGSVSKIDTDKERKDEKTNVDDDDDDDDVYSDALETLSSTESLSMNCSASGVSGWDNSDAKKSGTKSTDKQTQDLMMNRFLPAAKAMTFHPAQYASTRKQSVLAEQPRDVIRLVREERKSIVKKHITDIVPYTGQCQEEEEESSDDGDEYDDSTNISAKGCGMFHRLRARNSLCLLNPVPGMKMRSQLPISSAYENEKPNKSSHTPAIKKAWDAIHKNKSNSGASSPDMYEMRKKWTIESNRFSSSEMKQQGRLSPFRRSRTTVTAAVATASSTFQSKHQPLFPKARLHCDSRQAEKNQSEKLRFQSKGQGNIQEAPSKRSSSSSRSLAIEKTLYIDSVSTSRLSCSNSCPLDKAESLGTAVAILDKRSSITESFQDSKNLTDLEEGLDSEVSTTGQEDSKDQERLSIDQENNQESSMSLQLVQSPHDKDTEINNKQIVAVDHHGKVAGSELVVCNLPPPLPKSPSDSWLSRALPLVYMKNPFLYSNQDTLSLSRRHGLNASSRYTKWETIVKSSNLHHQGRHVSYSQEITIYKPQHHSKS